MKPIKPALAGAAFSLAIVGGAASANAAVVQNWIVTIDNSWSDTQFTSSGPGSFVPEDPFGTFERLPDGSDPRNLSYNVISWGTPRTEAGRSFLGVDESVSIAGLITNNTTGVVGASFYHGNYQQAASRPGEPAEQWLDSTVLNLRISLAPEGDTSRSLTFDHSIPIDFTETRNLTLLSACPGGGWPADTIACPDSLTTTTETTSFSFVLDEFRYLLTFLFDPANSQNVLRADTTETTATLWTAEGARSRLSTRLLIASEPVVAVPEPGSIGLAMVGFGLLGLGYRHRRRLSK